MNRSEFQKEIEQSPLPVIVEFWAPWCAPCRVMAPNLDKVDAQYKDQVRLWRINADQQTELVRSLGVMGIPTLLLLRQGQETDRRIGMQDLHALQNFFSAAASGEKPTKPVLTPVVRFLRLLAGTALLAIGWLSGPSLLLLASGGVVIFSAVYDRCPIWQALAPRLKAAFRMN